MLVATPLNNLCCLVNTCLCEGWIPNWDPAFTHASVDQSTQAIRGCGKQLPGTQRVKPSLLTPGVLFAALKSGPIM